MSSLLSSAEMWLNDDISSNSGNRGDRSKNIVPSGVARTLAVAAAANVFAASGTGITTNPTTTTTTATTTTTTPTAAAATAVGLEQQQPATPADEHHRQNHHSQNQNRDQNQKQNQEEKQEQKSSSPSTSAGQSTNMADTTSVEGELVGCPYIDEASPSGEQTGLKSTSSNENQNIRLHRLARSIRGRRPDPTKQQQQQQQAHNKGAVDQLVESVNGIDLKNDNKNAAESAELAATVVQRQDLKQQHLRQPNVQRQYQQRYSPVAHRRANFTDPNGSRLCHRPRKEIKLNKMDIPDHLIEAKYLIEKDTAKGGFLELGSGQFGKVYAAISEYKPIDTADRSIWSGVPVAIKEISKARFDLKQQAKLKNEAYILSGLDHPGVIILERVHDLPDKIYIVMEQLEDDMLEMIVSTPEKRLSERVTKFLTYQILEALKYLHAQKIAHCDLKPENVLLVDKHPYPQVKLCDFGFAKIIEENSFRSSLVGTPAYLAPEVVKGERYNRSVDLWSVGVIVYVSLSGEFPFNEGENIHDQISRANFMYPKEIWKNVSQQAMSFINSLLRVNCERRLSANTAQMDIWLQDFQLWSDLCDLELRVGKRWVTDDADYDRWSRYAKENGRRIPSSAVQLHMDLDYD